MQSLNSVAKLEVFFSFLICRDCIVAPDILISREKPYGQ